MKCKIEITRIMYPKTQIAAGDFAILVGDVLEIKEGEPPILNARYGTISIKGNVPSLSVGDIFDFKLGEPETNNYGVTYPIESVTIEVDKNNKHELENFLNIVCGASIARELVKLEKNPYDLLAERNREELLKVKGIGEKKLEYIFEQFDCLSDKSMAYAKLLPLGISKQMISKMCNKLGGSMGAISICFNNPYLLIDKVDGIGFFKADEIAQKTGYTNPSIRLRYAILHTMEVNAECGRSYLDTTQLCEEVGRLVQGIEENMFYNVMKGLLDERIIIVSGNGCHFALKKYYDLEESIADLVIDILKQPSRIKVPENWRETIKQMEEKQGWEYNQEQLKGIETGLFSNVCLIKGLAGTGKSTVSNAIVEILKDYEIEMCCLSAKAAQRLREITKMDAKTIHRALGLTPGEDEARELFADVVIVDEASMINGTIFRKLLGALLKGSKIIIMGDTGQLTAIGNCSVFADLLECDYIPKVELTEIHRQAQKSAIITESRKIREQKRIFDKGFKGKVILGELQDLELIVEGKDFDFLSEVVNKFKEELVKLGDVMEVQIITPLKTRGSLSALCINKEIQKNFNNLIGDNFKGASGTPIYMNDKVINLKNNYNSKSTEGKVCPIWNGSIGRIIEIKKDSCIIDFVGIGKVVVNKSDYENIELAYAISCHSSQGSQWKSVVCAFNSSAFILLNVEILYTAMTRASQHCTLAIENVAFNIAIENVEQNKKQTLLPYFLHKKRPV